MKAGGDISAVLPVESCDSNVAQETGGIYSADLVRFTNLQAGGSYDDYTR